MAYGVRVRIRVRVLGLGLGPRLISKAAKIISPCQFFSLHRVRVRVRVRIRVRVG